MKGDPPLDLEPDSAAEHRKKKRRKHHSSNGDRNKPSRYYHRSESPGSSTAPVNDIKGKGRSRSPDVDSDSYVPPRPRADRPYVPYTYDDDEGALPPASARKPDDGNNAEFTDKLFAAMREDEGYDPYSRSAQAAGYSYDYRESLDTKSHYGPSGVASDRFVDPESGFILNRVIFRDAMTDDEYAAHVRAGMFRRSKADELRAQEKYEKGQRAKERARVAAAAEQRAREEERMRKLEQRAQRKKDEGNVKSREAYQAAWARLIDPSRQGESLKMHDLPWPIGKESGGQLDAPSVQGFLLGHLDADVDINDSEKKKKRKQALRTAVLAYHPDRFERYVLRVQSAEERNSVREMGCESGCTVNVWTDRLMMMMLACLSFVVS